MQVRRWGVRLLGVAACLLLGSCAGTDFGFPSPRTSQARSTFRLWQGSVVAALCVGAVVWALVFYVIIRYRRRGDELPSQKQYNIGWEVAYTAIPVVIVAVLFGFTVGTQRKVEHLAASPAVALRATAYQWGWRFEYTGVGVTIETQGDQPPDLVVPVNQVVEITLVSADVVHGFFVPDFLFKRDAIPGITNRFDFTVTRTGTFGGHCSVFCGLRHARMLFDVRSLSRADFATWLSQHRSTA